jgi:hypothetical protein
VDVRLLFATRATSTVRSGWVASDDLFHRIAVARVMELPLRRQGCPTARSLVLSRARASPESLPKDLLRRWNSLRLAGQRAS